MFWHSPALSSSPLGRAVRFTVSDFEAQFSASEHEGLTNCSTDVAPSITLQVPDFDLEGGFVRGALSDNLKQSLNLIDKAETLSSCGKIATSALLHSCSDVEGSVDREDELPAGSDLMIEDASDVYAARLAVCELSGADFTVPVECRSFIPAAQGKKKRTTLKAWLSSSTQPKLRVANDYYDAVTKANLNQCRSAMGSSNQAWTSYSNSRQNAVAMCHAMQSAVEREESRHVAKILAHTAATASQSLKDAYEHVNEIKRQFHDLSFSMPKFQQDLAAFDEDTQQHYRAYWEQFTQVRSGLESLNAAIDLTNRMSKEAHEHLDAAIGTVIPDLRRAIVTASKEVSNTADTAAASVELMTWAKEHVEQVFIGHLDSAGYSLARINDILPQMSGRIETTLAETLHVTEMVLAQNRELSVRQNDTLAGIERIQQTSNEVEFSMDGIWAQMSDLSTKMNNTLSDFEKLQGFLGVLAPVFEFVGGQIAFGLCGFVFFLLLFGYMAEGKSGLASMCAGAVIGKSRFKPHTQQQLTFR